MFKIIVAIDLQLNFKIKSEVNMTSSILKLKLKIDFDQSLQTGLYFYLMP